MGTAAPDGADPDGGVVGGADWFVGTAAPDGADPDGGVVGGERVAEGDEAESVTVDGGGIGGDAVSEGASGPGDADPLRQPGELVGAPWQSGAVVGEGAGPLRSDKHPPWEAVVGEVFDVCDDSTPAVVLERALDSFEPSVFVPPRYEGDYGRSVNKYEIFDEFAGARKGNCGGFYEGMPRYAHMTAGGLGPVRDSPEEATEAVQDGPCLYGCGHRLGSGHYQSGYPVGFEMPYHVFAVEEPSDEVALLWDSVALLWDSVAVRDGDLLGLVQNRSAALFAREVTVMLRGHSWVFPLTVQPGEVAPFVVGAGTVSDLPERSEIEVSAALSPQPDLSRSFKFAPFYPMNTRWWDEEPYVSDYLADPDFPMNLAAMDLPLGPGDGVREWVTTVKLVEPNSHPGVAVGVADHVIEDPRAYLTFLDEHGRVFAVHRLGPINYRADPDEPLSGLPIIDDGYRHYSFKLEFMWLADSEYDLFEVETVLQVGGANPGP